MPEAKISPLDQVRLRQKIDREWVMYLTASEYMLIGHIFHRSIAWQKKAEYISSSDMERKLPLSMRTIKSTTKKLRNDGALLADWRGKKPSYRINFDWKPGKSREPKKAKHVSSASKSAETGLDWCKNDHSTGVKITTEPVQNLHPIIRKRKRNSEQRNSGDAAGASSAHGRVQALVDQAGEDSRLSRSRKKTDGVSGWEKEWQDRYKSAFGAFPAGWRKKDQIGMKRLKKRMMEPHDDMFAFIGWLIDNWSLILKFEFDWMKRPPKFPEVDMVIRWFDRFHSLWTDWETDRLKSFRQRHEEYVTMLRSGRRNAVPKPKSAPKPSRTSTPAHRTPPRSIRGPMKRNYWDEEQRGLS